MRTSRDARNRGHIRILVFLLLAIGAVWPAAAEDTRLVVRGQVTDVMGEPLVGYRVVFRVADEAEVVLSSPTEQDGEYAVPLPAGPRYVVVAVVGPTGLRVGFDPPLSVPATTGARLDIQVTAPAAGPTVEEYRPFPGSGRLIQSFVEDTAMVNRYRFEGRFEYADDEAGDRMVARALAAIQFRNLPRFEFGASLGIAGLDRPDPLSDESGATDVDLWSKLHIGPRWSQRADFSVGAIATLPVGQEGNGESFDSFRSKLFAAMRYRFESFTVATHVGVRFNGDGKVGDVILNGKTAGAIGAAVLYPVTADAILVGEATWEGERFDGADPDARLLAGVNWRALPHGVVRLAVATGVADGAPDTQFLAGYSFDF